MLGERGYFTSLIGKAHFRAWNDPDSFESVCKSTDWDFYSKWTGPYHGFQHVKLKILHNVSDHGASAHYGLWLREKGITDFSPYFGRGIFEKNPVCQMPEEYSSTAWIGGETIAAIDMSIKADKPFFIWSSFDDPHWPYTVSEPWASLHDPEDMPNYTHIEGEFDNKPPFYRSVIEHKNYGGADGDPELADPYECVTGGGRNHPDNEGAVGGAKSSMAIYYGMMSQVDHHIGLVVEHLKARGLYDNTLIIFTTDHGEFKGNHGYGAKGLPAFEDSQKIPFIVRHPMCRTRGAHSGAHQNLVDISRTILAAAGITTPPGMQGFDQTESWQDANITARDYNYIEYRPTQSSFAQRTFIYGDYKLVVYRNRTYGELYNTSTDPDQYSNLWDNPAYAGIKADLTRRLVDAQIDLDGELRLRTSFS